MNIWTQIALKMGEKLLINQIKYNVWNNHYTTYQQKRITSNLLDGLSLAKDVYDIIRIADELDNSSKRGGTTDE